MNVDLGIYPRKRGMTMQKGALLAVALVVAAIPASVSFALRPFLYQVRVEAPSTIDLPGETALVELARIEQLRLYTGTLQTLMPPAKEWPFGPPRDACVIETPPKQPNSAPPKSPWTDRVISRMFLGRINPADAKALDYEMEGLGAQQRLEGEMAAAVDFLQAIEPYRDSVPFGQVRYFAVRPGMEYATRTGIRHILSVAVYPISQEPPIQTSGKKTIPVSTLGAPVAEAINIAKKNGVRFLSIPFIGAKPDDDDVEVYDVLLQTAVDAAKNPGTLTAIYINTYGDSPVRRTQLLSAFNTAWQKLRLKLLARQNELVDLSWRLTSVISVVAVASLWSKRRRQTFSAQSIVKFSVAILLLAKGLSETISPVIVTLASDLAPDFLFPFLIGVGAVVGWFLPSATMFDPRAVVRTEAAGGS